MATPFFQIDPSIPKREQALRWQVRSLVRSFLLTATPTELRRELELSQANGDTRRAAAVQELIDED